MSPKGTRRWRPGWKTVALVSYAVLLFVSHLVSSRRAGDELSRDVNSVAVPAVEGERRKDAAVRVAFREFVPEGRADAPVVVLLHGSPGGKEDFRSLAPLLAQSYRVIAPDLPGFGSSTRDIPDYSLGAHARYLLDMLDRLGVERAHFVGFSMGGGVALAVADIAPARVRSIVLLSSVGVQEMELLGDYHLNHALHGLLVGGSWLLRAGVPHMGLLGDGGKSFARNFYDSDQRPLRGALMAYAGPMLIIHGEQDPLVPVEAAREHYRLVPQSELQLVDESHFMVFTKADVPAALALDFLARVEEGRTRVRADADAARIARAAAPFNPADVPRARGLAAVVLALLLAVSTLVSEDLTCVAAGVLAAEGRTSFTLAASACLAGIYVGDVLLFLAGRWLGRPAVRRAPLCWFVKPEDVEKSSAWFNRRGSAVILLSRFLPGTRLPTYFAAGLLNTSFWKFSFYFLVAAVIWTPALVGLSMMLGAEVIQSSLLAGQSLILRIVLGGLAAFIAVKLLVRLATYRGRRLLVSRWRRLVRWEFWPLWAFYPPVVCYIAWLALKHGSPTVFTCANPAIRAGGFVGESKIEILRALSAPAASQPFVARAELLGVSLSADARLAAARDFMLRHGLSFPVVLKPDAGERGAGVGIIKHDEELEEYLRQAAGDTIIQEYVPGFEFGVFYYRHPDEERGRIFAVTDKRFPAVTGDGVSTLERLILADERAVCMANFHFRKHAARLWDVPAAGEVVRLVELGTHCRGALFLEGGWVKTPELERAIDRLARGYEGFYFGRFDIRTPSIADFQRGENFKAVELNGVTSEATNIYDPQNGLFAAYKVLFAQWRIAFCIGARNRERGVRPTPLAALYRLLFERAGGDRSAPPAVAGERADCGL